MCLLLSINLLIHRKNIQKIMVIFHNSNDEEFVIYDHTMHTFKRNIFDCT